MGIAVLGSAVRRGMTVAAVGAGLSILLCAQAGASARARSSAALYYETRNPSGSLAIARLSLVGPPVRTKIVGVGQANVFGLALGGPYIFWTFEVGPRNRGAVMSVSLDGRHVRRLVPGLTAPASVLAVHGFVYWADQNEIGRVALDGSHLQRHFIVLPEEFGGGVADGLATDGSHLFFSRCLDNEIGRANLDGTHVEQQFLVLPRKSCPQGLAVGGNHLYWTELAIGTIGRATLGGARANRRWLNVHTGQGPFQVAADGAHIYWSWGGVAGSPAFTGRADANGSHLDRTFLPNSVYPMALA
jgi:virginiamycin B lyase